MDDWGPWIALLVATAATYVWRAAGATLAARISPSGAVFEWFSCVAYAMLAGLIARVILLPVGILGEAPTLDRLVATAVGLALFFAFGRHLLFGTVGGVGAFLALAGLRAAGIL